MAEFIAEVDELYADISILLVAHELGLRLEDHPEQAKTIRDRIQQLLAITIDKTAPSVEFIRTDTFALEKELNIEKQTILQVVSVKYGSEGGFDFLGFGKIADAVANVFNGILEHIGRGPERELKRLEAIKEKLKIADLTGMTEEQKEGYARELFSKHDKVLKKYLESERVKNTVKLIPPPKNVEQRKPPSYYL